MEVGIPEDMFESLCRENNITVNIVENVGSRIRGFCYFDGDEYRVILNNRFDSYQLKRTVIHEVIHILEEHFKYPVYKGELCEYEVSLIINQFKYAIAY